MMELITGYLAIMGFLYLLAGGIIGGIALYNYNISLFIIIYSGIVFLIWGKKLFQPKTFLSKMFLCCISVLVILAIAEYYNLDKNNFYINLCLNSLQITFTVIAIINFILFFRTVYILDKEDQYNIRNYILYNLPLSYYNGRNIEFEHYLKELKLWRDT